MWHHIKGTLVSQELDTHFSVPGPSCPLLYPKLPPAQLLVLITQLASGLLALLLCPVLYPVLVSPLTDTPGHIQSAL